MELTANKPVQDGLRTIRTRLAQSVRGHCTDAPFPLSLEEAALWHRAQASAYQFVLDTLSDTPMPEMNASYPDEMDEADWTVPGPG